MKVGDTRRAEVALLSGKNVSRVGVSFASAYGIESVRGERKRFAYGLGLAHPPAQVGVFDRHSIGTTPASSTLAMDPRRPNPSEMLAQARLELQARDDLLAIAGHEPRNPLNALSLRVVLALRLAERRSDTEMVNELAGIQRLLERCISRATMLLDLSRLSAGAPRLQRTAIDLKVVIERAVELYDDEATARGTPVRLDVESSMVGYWDADAIEQIVTNLVSNAIKYGAGTPVTVRAHRTPPGWVTIAVADGGPGVPEAQRELIFAKFERILREGTSAQGYGLGLWIVRQLAEAHGGTVDVQDAPGGGSVFSVTLPTISEVRTTDPTDERPDRSR